jgi:tetratricopeptide (TPR) repeat protein
MASRIYLAKEDLMNAKMCLDKSLDAVENHVGPWSSKEADVWIGWGEFYALNKEYSKAEEACQKGLKMLDNVESDHNRRVALALHNLARIYIDQGRYSEAQPPCHRAVVLLESVYDQDHPIVADVLETLVKAHDRSGDSIEVTKLKQRIENIDLSQRMLSAPIATAIE